MKYFIGFLVTIGLIILLIVLLASGGGKPKVQTTQRSLISYANSDAVVRMTIDGPINANQDHRQIQVTVNRDQVTFEQMNGYDGQVAAQQQYASTQNAYTNFLAALTRANFTKGDSSKDMADERGLCPLGDRFVFELIDNGTDVQRFWATSCGGTKTYQGNLNLTVQLFRLQVPDYDTLAGTAGI